MTVSSVTKAFAVIFTPHDASSTDPNEITYELRTAAGGLGTLLDTGTCTDSVPATTATVVDLTLVEGFNARYLRFRDGAGNWSGDTVVTVQVEAPASATPDDVAQALVDNVFVYYVFEWRTNDFAFLADLSAAISHVSIDLNNDRAIVRLMRCEIDPSQLPVGFVANEANVAVNGVLDVSGVPTLFTLGLFRLDLSEEDLYPLGESNWPSVEGSDLTVLLQLARFDEPYVIAAGTNVIAAVRALCESESLKHDFEDDTNTLPIDAVGEPNSTKLDLVNRLLKAINWFPCFSTEKGVQTSRLRANPEDEPVDVIYSATNEPRMIVSPFKRKTNRSQPNRVTVKIDDPLRTLAQVTLQNADAASPVSTANSAIRAQDVSSGLIIDATMARSIAEVEVREWAARGVVGALLTDFDPRRQPHETYRLHLDDFETGTIWRVVSWQLDLATAEWGNSLMQHEIGRVQTITPVVVP